MTSSAYGTQQYVVRGVSIGSAEPLDAHHMRDAMSSAAHLADQSSQVRVAWASSSGIGKGATPRVDGQWTCLWLSAPWMARVAPDGVYRVRVRIAAARVGTTGTAHLSLRVGPYPLTFSGGAFVTASTTSSSIAWLTATAIAFRPAYQIAEFAARDAIGGPTVGIESAMLGAGVWLRQASGDVDALLHGVYIAEVY